ncbi:restriction endonuclease subunit S [Zhongshania guokunii]|uniref:Restriction endonuclease subunit S n=1 Tax=Zhongshania guokunii TaxID=641783 RepID=A0ABV3UB93_9GAMM
MPARLQISHLFNVRSSKRVLKSQWQKSGVPFFRGREISTLSKTGCVDNELFISEELYLEFTSKYGVPKTGDIVITAIGTIGNSYIVKDSDRFYFKDASVLWLEKKADVDSRFIDLWFKSSNMWNQLDHGKGATVDTLTISKLASLKIDLPPLPEQKRVVALLDSAFADIDKARTNAEQNLKNARELFESYLQQAFHQRDESWINVGMSDICEITPKLVDPKEDQYIDLPHIGAGNIITNTGELIDVKTAREENLISGKFIFDDSMVLYSKIRPYLMKVCRPSFTGLCSADVYPLSPIPKKIDKNYLFYLLLTKDFTDYAIAGSGRAGMPKVNRIHLFNYQVSIPNLEKQSLLVKKIDLIVEQSQALEQHYSLKLSLLDELKKSLLHKAFTGQLSANVAKAATDGQAA